MTMQMLNFLAASNPGFFYPIQASTIARDVDPLAWFIHGMTIFFTVGIIAATVWFVIRYRASVHPVPEPPGHNNVLEITWTAIPAIIVFVCFFWGFRVYMKMVVPRPDALKMEAVGLQWAWQFKYPSPVGSAPSLDTTLYLPVNTPVEITLTTKDVLHALFIPAMRVKKDVVPGRYNTMLVEATREGTYDIYCAEYCGDSHSTMWAKAVVLSKDAYDAKMQEISVVFKQDDPPAVRGQKIANVNGCFSCHSIDGKAGTGPTWLDLYGATGHPLYDGSTVTVDDNYILESIRNPNAKVAKAFGPSSAMTAYPKTAISDEYVQYIIAYQKSISKHAPKDATPPADAPSAQPAP